MSNYQTIVKNQIRDPKLQQLFLSLEKKLKSTDLNLINQELKSFLSEETANLAIEKYFQDQKFNEKELIHYLTNNYFIKSLVFERQFLSLMLDNEFTSKWKDNFFMQLFIHYATTPAGNDFLKNASIDFQATAGMNRTLLSEEGETIALSLIQTYKTLSTFELLREIFPSFYEKRDNEKFTVAPAIVKVNLINTEFDAGINAKLLKYQEQPLFDTYTPICELRDGTQVQSVFGKKIIDEAKAKKKKTIKVFLLSPED